MLIKNTENVPEVYVKNSRDFQLLCRVLDAVENSSLGYISRMLDQVLPATCDERLLTAMSSRVGFFTNEYIAPPVLRNILVLFPYIRKYKGSPTGIEYAAKAVLKDYKQVISIDINIQNKQGDVDLPQYTVQVIAYVTELIDIDLTYIKEVMKYALPAGYLFVLTQHDPEGKEKSNYIVI